MPTTNLRALTTFDHLPSDHATFWVNDDASAPHLDIGEFAVVDTTDRKLQHGELYLMQSNSGRRERSIVQTMIWSNGYDSDDLYLLDADGKPSNEAIWATKTLKGFRKVGEFEGMPLFAGMCDTYRATWLEKQLIGRVVGVASGPLGNLLAPAAGYIEEQSANDAFDEHEYLDVMIATGHQPRVQRGNDGQWWYFEKMHERNFDRFPRDYVLALRSKEGAASTGMDRIIAECLRRGLID